jgi:hypothetical protein
MIDEDATHRLRRRAVEMDPVVESSIGRAGEPQEGLVDERRRLQRVPDRSCRM